MNRKGSMLLFLRGRTARTGLSVTPLLGGVIWCAKFSFLAVFSTKVSSLEGSYAPDLPDGGSTDSDCFMSIVLAGVYPVHQPDRSFRCRFSGSTGDKRHYLEDRIRDHLTGARL